MDDQPEPTDGRWELLRDVARFQLKLLMDGLRDLLMSPVSLVAAAAGLLLEPRHPRRYFERALSFGRRTEEWINLFDRAQRPEDTGVDELFQRLEARLIEQYQRGGVTSGAKQAIDTSLDRLHQAIDAMRRRAAGRTAAAMDQPTDDAGA